MLSPPAPQTEIVTVDTASVPTASTASSRVNRTPSEDGLRPRWRVRLALAAMMLTSFSLVSVEFLPGGIVTILAEELQVTPGQAGQTVTVTALVGFIVAPLVSVMFPRMDRRTLLVALAVAATASNIIVAIAPSLWVLLAGRVLLGAALSGFWSMSLTIAARIGGSQHVARSMMFVGAGTTLATVLGVPAGVWLTSLVGWRSVFVIAAVVSLVTALALLVLLPRVSAEKGTSLAALADTMRRPGVGLGLAGHVFVVMGHIAAYAYAAVALERVAGPDAVPTLLLAFGIGGFVGNFVIGSLADRWLAPLKFVVPGLIVVGVLAVSLGPDVPVVPWVATVIWGVAFGGWLNVINAWTARQVPDRLEAGGGLVVAGFQLAIMLGAAIGGLLVDAMGIATTLLVAATLGALGTLLFGFAGLGRTRDASPLAPKVATPATPTGSIPCVAGTPC